jgi:hypothetical protein
MYTNQRIEEGGKKEEYTSQALSSVGYVEEMRREMERDEKKKEYKMKGIKE